MAMQVGHSVTLPRTSYGVSNSNHALKDTSMLSWKSVRRGKQIFPGVSLKSSSGRPLSLQISDQPKTGWAAFKVYNLEKETPGSVSLSEFEARLTDLGQEVARLNNNKNIFLVGMMGCGKSTVGKILADALGYKYRDSDDEIEKIEGGLAVKEIFRLKGETQFRKTESDALRKLCEKKDLVVATGGGAVIYDANWEYLGNGITVWLDVPVKVLAKRVTAVGTGSRPLLGDGCADFESVLLKLSTLMKERKAQYSKAHCRLCFEELAKSLQSTEEHEPTVEAIVVQILEEIRHYLLHGKRTPAPELSTNLARDIEENRAASAA
ncbi:uncharacterized protein [Physcomitrium patens]|uniref:shikimate kinase n=1 Tax=Physcomitrium patens TaxID=3218 RepID=A0A2K1JM59_PHYPA|nr:shikimate kinase, chloroplastic-like [Physcomitrium patens]XP_024392958.1 shikimate kinase, chloroplastic-like [Physcomitrium patens]XP_024392959.1 shikimate kinase, chloroplastic-like [Physcomitrium patens]PNR42632.1 hypothetical protein PHYPA_017462 [Physcomitrium patens]|eukprot:XP_024392957.1 shikimate kinase, chloroplastic-like [Physcomitrella patens]